MELFSFLIQPSQVSSDALAGKLNEAVQDLHMNKLRVQWTAVEGRPYEKIVCAAEGTSAQLEAYRSDLCRAASQAVAEYVIDHLEEDQLRAVIRKDYGYDEQTEIEKIIACCREAADGNGMEGMHSKAQRQKSISAELTAFLNAHHEVNLRGFLQFRVKSYMDQLQDIADYAIDEYLMEKQYQEFISLLKYFVYIQEAKIPIAHLMHKGENDFVLLNEDMNPIDTKHIGGMVVEMMDKDINYEDMIVSTLISVSPQKVYIHTREPEKQVIKTIQQIFENRTSLCTYCSMCKPILGKKRKNRLYP